MNATQRRLVRSTQSFRNAEEAAVERRLMRDDAIKAAYLDGIGASEIAELTGLSRPYVHMLVKPVKA